jgi:ornithine carbamoyltransferase
LPRHFLDLFDLTSAEAHDLLERACTRKSDRSTGVRTTPLAGKVLGLMFEKPSLRTRVSFESAAAQLGGSSIFLKGAEVGLGVRETVPDFARVISQYVDVLAVRTFAHELVEELAAHATVPVINALSDDEHPCQAMADMLTLWEQFGRLKGLTLVFVGDGNNVARSLASAAALFGVRFVLACPEGYAFPAEFVKQFAARFPGVGLHVEHDPRRAVAGADALYTDVWASMGQEDEAAERRRVFAPYQVDQSLMDRAAPEAILLHCLPAHRGEEVSAEVLDGPQSRVIPQAGNRLHFQAELLVWLLNGGCTSELGSESNGRTGTAIRRS